MQVSLKGARALIKVFTDLQASVEDVQSWFSVGLEPVIGLVRTCCPFNTLSRRRYTYLAGDLPDQSAHASLTRAHELQLTQAGKRLSPSDPDKSKAPSVTLPVWDMMRMLWRGQIGLTARSAPLLSLCHVAARAPAVCSS